MRGVVIPMAILSFLSSCAHVPSHNERFAAAVCIRDELSTSRLATEVILTTRLGKPTLTFRYGDTSLSGWIEVLPEQDGSGRFEYVSTVRTPDGDELSRFVQRACNVVEIVFVV